MIYLQFVFAIALAAYHHVQGVDASDPLYLTPLIKSGHIGTARKLSIVKDLPNAPWVRSYSGLLTVNETYNSNMFFWFFPALDGNKEAPIILWLQGGPGLTGLFGVFHEHGPYFINPDMTVGLRKYTWTRNFQIIYVDNPVGTGFSFTDDERGYVRNQDQMAKNMLEFLNQFFDLFHEYRRNDFYIGGESYGGKFAPSVAYEIHKNGDAEKMNLKGMAIGNGFCDPETMLGHSKYFYQIGLVDQKRAHTIQKVSDSIVEQIRQGNYLTALSLVTRLFLDFGSNSGGDTYFKNATGYNYLFNYLMTERPVELGYHRIYIKNPEVLNALHLGDLKFQDGIVQQHLLQDIMQSVKSKVKVIMNNYRVLFYNGQLDLVVPYPMTVNFLRSVDWKYAEEYCSADRTIWKLKDTDYIAGYVHAVENIFFEVLVRNTGHLAIYDQPKVALELAKRFFNQECFD